MKKKNKSNKLSINDPRAPLHMTYLYLVPPQAVEKLVQGAESGCPTEKERQAVLNCARILSRVLPYIFEDQDWRGFFWSTVPGAGRAGVSGQGVTQRSLWEKKM